MTASTQPLNTTPEPEIDPRLAARLYTAGRWWAAIVARNGMATRQQVAAHGFDQAEIDAHWPMIVAHGQAVLYFGLHSTPSVRRTLDPDAAT